MKKSYFLNSQLLESPAAEVLIAKLYQELFIHVGHQGGHFKWKPQSDEPGVTEVPRPQTLHHTKCIQEIWAWLIHGLEGKPNLRWFLHLKTNF